MQNGHCLPALFQDPSFWWSAPVSWHRALHECHVPHSLPALEKCKGPPLFFAPRAALMGHQGPSPSPTSRPFLPQHLTFSLPG